MTFSQSEAVHWTCDFCGEPNTSEAWRVIDVERRRDLYRRVLDDAIHRLRCPSCLSGKIDLEAPLLLIRLDDDPNLVIVLPSLPDPDDGADRAGAAGDLLSWARAAIDGDLSGPVELRTVDADRLLEIWEDIERLDGTDPLLESFLAFLNAEGASELRSVLSENPDLFGLTAKELLQRYASINRREQNEMRLEHIEDKIRLLRRIDELGADAAFGEFEHGLQWQTIANLDRETVELLRAASEPAWRPEDCAERINLCHRALARIDRTQSPKFWCISRVILANRLRELPDGNRSQNVEEAIGILKSVLDEVSPELDRRQWVSAVAGLANALQERIQGIRAQNFDEAIALCENALMEIHKDEGQSEYCALLDVLGSARLDHPSGDKVDDLERAIAAYEAALDLEEVPALRSVILTNLARAYLLRRRGARSENLQKSIEINQQLIDEGAFRSDPVSFATTAENLAVAYLARETVGDIDRAIPLLEAALSVRSKAAMPLEWAQTTMNLGTAYVQIRDGDLVEYGRRGITCFEDVLSVIDEIRLPTLWADAQANLGTILSLDSRSADLRDEDRAVAAFRAALSVHTPTTDPQRCRRYSWSLASLHAQREEWAEALAVLNQAIEAGCSLYRSSFLPSSREIEMKTNADLYDLAITACGHVGTPEAARSALVYAEAARDRLFMDEMSTGDLPPAAGVEPEDLQRESELIGSWREIQAELAQSFLPPDYVRDLEANSRRVQSSLEQLWSDMAAIDAGYVALRRGDTPSWEDLASLSERLGPRAAIVSLYTLPDEIVCFVVRAGTSYPKVIRRPISRQQLLYRYLLPYQDDVLQPAAGHRPSHAWTQLGEELLKPLESELSDAGTVYLIPHGYLHTVPLHALSVAGQPFIENRAVVYAPSAGVLQRILESTQRSGSPGKPVLLGYTPSDDEEERALFLGEAQVLADFFGVAALLDADATSVALRRNSSASLFHLSCHGRFDHEDPLASGTLLADGLLTCRDWMALTLDAGLITLSACESGFSRTGRGDELTGLTRSLLYAGARSCLLALWSVNAATTLTWMSDFYAHVWDSHGTQVASKAEGFQLATLALREQDDDPSVWAPYVLVGGWR